LKINQREKRLERWRAVIRRLTEADQKNREQGTRERC